MDYTGLQTNSLDKYVQKFVSNNPEFYAVQLLSSNSMSSFKVCLQITARVN